MYWVGFCLISLGTASAVSAFINGYLIRLVPQYILVYIGIVLNTGTIIFLLVWDIQPTYFVVLIIFILGYCEGIWTSMPGSKCNSIKIMNFINNYVFIGLVGTIVAHKDKEATHSYYRMGMALGFSIIMLPCINYI